MAERVSALSHLTGGGPSAQAGARATLSERRPGSILQVAAWPDTTETVRAAITDLLGIQVPAVGFAYADANVTVAAIAPGRFMIAGSAADLPHRFEAALQSDQAAVTDLSHGRTILRLDGDAATTVLASCIALDLHPTAFPRGRVAQTSVHHIDVLLHRLSDTTYELWALRSFAEALAEWILDAGVEHGIVFAGGIPPS
jgi:sarcosine oxidase subunit gamma